MSLFRRGNVWWYEFWFANRRVRESAKTTSKTLAKAAEQKRRRAPETLRLIAEPLLRRVDRMR
jgi:hypothetical protein